MTIVYVHWNEQELVERIEPLKAAGHHIIPHHISGHKLSFDQLPDVFIISLDRLPSHGKAIAEWVWEAKKRQHIPIVFEGGQAEKITSFEERFPKAIFVEKGATFPTIQQLTDRS